MWVYAKKISPLTKLEGSARSTSTALQTYAMNKIAQRLGLGVIMK